MKKIISLILVAAVLALTLCACGDNGKINDENLIPITAGVSVGKSPQDEVMYGLELHFPEYGYKLVYKEYETSEQALEALEKGEIDFSLISRKSEYEAFGSEELLNLGPVYFYPYAVYLKAFDTRAEITDGASIAIPDDAEGMARALMLLDAEGFIKLKEGAGLSATLEDIEENKKEYKISAVAHKDVATSGADILVMGSDEARAAGYERRFDGLVSEKSESEAAVQYATVCLVRKADLRSDKIALVSKYFFTRRMFNSIDASTANIIEPMFELK